MRLRVGPIGGALSVAVRHGAVVWSDDSCGSRAELGDSDEVVSGGYQVGMHRHPRTASVTGAAQAAAPSSSSQTLLHPACGSTG